MDDFERIAKQLKMTPTELKAKVAKQLKINEAKANEVNNIKDTYKNRKKYNNVRIKRI